MKHSFYCEIEVRNILGIGKNNDFNSKEVDYSTPIKLFKPLADEFNLKIDVCASHENKKLDTYWIIQDDALQQDWCGTCWMNPPYTNKNDTVVDCTAGSGTTAVACINTGRNFIVNDNSYEYYELMENRINNIKTA